MGNNHHHIYSPIKWQAEIGHRVYEETNGQPRCREAVHEKHSVGFYQCQRVGTVQETIDGETLWFCRQHSAAETAKRAREATERHKAKMAPKLAAWAAQKNATKFQAALEAIAAGHNDARNLAAETLREAGVVS